MSGQGSRNVSEKKTLIGIIYLGFSAALSGILVLADYGNHLGHLSSQKSSVTPLLKKAFLISGESLSAMVFSCMSIFLMLFLNDPGLFKKLSRITLLLKILFMLLLYIPYLKTWYFILDPNGSHTGVFFVIVFSGLQLLALMILNYRLTAIRRT